MQGKPDLNRETVAVARGEGKLKLVYMAGYALSFMFLPLRPSMHIGRT